MIFNNKTVVITGGSEGVGAATARLFAEAGANLMLVARNKKNLDAIAEELRAKTKVEVFAMDVSDAPNSQRSVHLRSFGERLLPPDDPLGRDFSA